MSAQNALAITGLTLVVLGFYIKEAAQRRSDRTLAARLVGAGLALVTVAAWWAVIA